MTGNVWEWTADWYSDKYQFRVLRGGSWINVPESGRVSNRLKNPPRNRLAYIGFRCAQ